jgi:hypothetical protein
MAKDNVEDETSRRKIGHAVWNEWKVTPNQGMLSSSRRNKKRRQEEEKTSAPKHRIVHGSFFLPH